MKKKEKKKRNRSNLLAVLALSVMLAVLLVGCKKPSEEPTPPASEVVSEVVSEEVSEPTSEEPSEVVSEEVSEEISEEPEIIDGVQTVYCESYEEMTPYFDALEEPVIVVFNFSQAEKGQVLLYDGAHYTIPKDFFITIRATKEILTIKRDAEYIFVTQDNKVEWAMLIETTGTDIEVPLNIVYADGTEETLTVYITKEWE